jgi:cytidylate kinase
VRARGGDPDDPAAALAACNFAAELLGHPDLRSEETGGLASRVSIHPAVRSALYQRQRAFACQPGGAVLDGRDIGTVIAPDAEVKLFVTASLAARAERRLAEMLGRGAGATLDEITAALAARDARDAARTDAPLLAAADAIVLDTTLYGRDEAAARAVALVEAAVSRRCAPPPPDRA